MIGCRPFIGKQIQMNMAVPWSFATEISPGPSIPPYESLIKFIPKDSISNTNTDWLYHCGTMQFGNTKIFDNALDERYGKSSNMHQYLAKAQLQNYEGTSCHDGSLWIT